MTDETEVDTLLEERPDLESAVATVLEVDDRLEKWTFGDVGVDSGAFGELVSRGIVERDDDKYRVADPASVRAALDGEPTTGESEDQLRSLVDDVFERPIGDFDLHPRAVAALAGALVVVALFRLTTWTAVFRGGDVVSPANDPYFYRYWFERVAADGVPIAALPESVANGEPLLVAILAATTSLLGGGGWAAGRVAAWYPVVVAILTGILVYWFATELTDDRRVGLASVLLLAVLPAHAVRTTLAFTDHHAFDYLWLVLTATSAVALSRREGNISSLHPRTVLGVTGLAAGVAGQVLAWDNGPLLLLPLVVYFPLATLSAVRREVSPLSESGVLLAGIGGGAVVTVAVHLGWGWHTWLVGVMPTALFVGAASVTLVGEATYRIDLPIEDELAAAGTVLGGGVVIGATLLAVTEVASTVTERADILFVDRAIGETASLFASGASGFGWLLLVGPILFVGTAGLVWATFRKARDSPRWLVAVTYGWVFLLLAAVQKRFAGELGPFIATFAGLGLVVIAWKAEHARPPVPFADGERPPISDDLRLPGMKQLLTLLLLFLLIGGLGAILTPIITNNVTYTEGAYETATLMSEYTDAHEGDYPANYVLSGWSQNRMYNYFVNGNAASYSFARVQYEPFLRQQDPAGWYDQYGDRVGFVVIPPGLSADYPLLAARLDEGYGSRSEGVEGVGHFRLVYERQYTDGTYSVFHVVPGATVTGTTTPNGTVWANTSVSVDGTRFDYRRRVEATPSGTFEVTLAYPGEYTVNGQRVVVPEATVERGRTITIDG